MVHIHLTPLYIIFIELSFPEMYFVLNESFEILMLIHLWCTYSCTGPLNGLLVWLQRRLMVIKGTATGYPNKEMRTEIAVSGLKMHNGDVSKWR